MPQLVKKRRSGWAVLAAGAMVASILAVGASPAAAAPIDAISGGGAPPTWTACIGPAHDDAGFADVSGFHTDNINCIAHYGITTGREGGTEYAPHNSVTRSQMSLFLSRMAGVAGVELDDAMGAGFTDLDGIGADRVDAINRLVNAGIMTGTSDDTFSPLASVSRAEMALWLVNFMVAVTGESDPINVKQNRDGTYSVSGVSEDNFFTDSRQTQPAHVDSAISAAFELAITVGYSDHTFRPSRAVSRQEMATFITRTLDHTNARPAGLNAQARGNADVGWDIQVTNRDAAFTPIPNEPIDMFGTNYPDDLFDPDDGSCDGRFSIALAPSFDACEIDAGDMVTDDDGNAEYEADPPDIGRDAITVACSAVSGVGGGNFPAGDPERFDDAHNSWAWTGDLGDEVDEDSDIVGTIVFANTRRPRQLAPHHAEVTGGLDRDAGQQEARMGQTVEYTLQLHADPDILGPMGEHLATGPDSSGNKYVVAETRNNHAYEIYNTDTMQVVQQHEDNADGERVTVRRKVSDDSSTDDVDERVGTTIVSRTPRIVEPDSNGTLTLSITQPDRNSGINDDDVFVQIAISPYDGTPGESDRNGARGDDDLEPFENFTDYGSIGTLDGAIWFTDRVLFSDDGANEDRYTLRGASSGYRQAPGSGRANNYVTVTVIDHYGRPVRAFPVNAVSDRNGLDDQGDPAEDEVGRSTLPFVQYYTTRSNGSYSIGYVYTGGAVVETLRVFGHEDRPERDTLGDNGLAVVAPDPANQVVGNPPDGVLDVPSGEEAIPGTWRSALGPSATDPTAIVEKVVTMYWANTGRDKAAPDGGYNDTDDEILVVDVENKTFVVREGTAGSPEMYSWDDVDTFAVGGDPVGMEVFEAVLTAHLETAADSNPKRPRDVELQRIEWSSYDYNRPVDRANWIIHATCTERP